MESRAEKRAARKAAKGALKRKPWLVRIAARIAGSFKPKRPMEMADDEPNKIHGKKWKRVAKIGQGSFGLVYIGQRVKDGMVFAVKSACMEWEPECPRGMKQALQNEISKLSQIRCKYIVRMLGCGHSDMSNKLEEDILDAYAHKHPNHRPKGPMLDLFLEYIPRGSLSHMMARLKMGSTMVETHYLAQRRPLGKISKEGAAYYERWNRRLPEDYVRAYTEDILRAVDYLHRKQLVHGDIKPLNILVAEDCLKLADFGGCKSLKKETLTSFKIHTGDYTAPEVHHKVQQGFASDVFSVGCTVLEMVAGSAGVYIPNWVSPELRSFLRRCLTTDPYRRWTAAQLLEHPFIRDRDRNDNRPYATVIPEGAERMILQPPPVEAYTDTMLSPTYTGNEPYVDPVDPIIMGLKIYDNKSTIRKERIGISGDPIITVRDGQYSSSDLFGTEDDSSHRSESPEFQTSLPDYEPEFVPPRNHSVHFLLPSVASREGNNKSTDLDSGSQLQQLFNTDPSIRECSEEKPRGMQRKPPPLDVADSYSGSQLQQLFNTDPSIRECNEAIREEAQIAEEAGIYVNKLCPLSDEENSKSGKSPTRKGRSNNPTDTGLSTVSALLGSFSCKQADTHIAMNSSGARPEYDPSSGPGSPVNLGER
ncbi:unnamed protein product [Calypogeia fissa]